MTALNPLSISVHAKNPRMVDELCRATMDCGSTPETSYLHLLIATLFLLVFVLAATVVHLRSAKNAVSEERSRTAQEREAFADFIRRVAAIDSESATTQLLSTAGPLSLATKTQSSPSLVTRHLEQVTDAYQETVMALPHYEEDYGEPISVNMAAEFGEDLSTAITSGTQFTPQLKHALIMQARDSFQQRTDLLSRIHHEADSLDTAFSTLEEIEQQLDELDDGTVSTKQFDELRDIWDQLDHFEENCNSLLMSRQSHINDRTASTPDFYDYLYRSLPITYPVLNDALSLLDRIKIARGHVLRVLTHRA